MNLANYLTVIGFAIIVLTIIAAGIAFLLMYRKDHSQGEHPILRNYPVLGRVRYFLENIGPEMRQYWFDSDTEGKPFSRNQYQNIVKSAKYQREVLGFGAERDYDAAGYYLANTMFPKQADEMQVNHETQVRTKKYILLKDSLFGQREEKLEDNQTSAYLLKDDDAIVIGPDAAHPFVVKSLVGQSAMSYGSLGERAITALSKGLAMAKGTWMNTGEGGLSSHHLKGGTDIIQQIGSGLFGFRDKDGNFSWEELKKKGDMEEIKAFELKLAQGAKQRGGHVDAEKVTPEIADIRKVEPYQSIESPNRFHQFDDVSTLLDFVEKIRDHTGKPCGIKVVIGRNDSLVPLAKKMKETGKSPDHITIDGGEGGTGASYQELMESVGLPIKSALPIVDATLRHYGVRDQVKIIASGKLETPDKSAMALAMGADLINIARGFMVTVGCIQTLKCHANICPVGVATTDPDLQKALVVDEKKNRVANYLVTMRKGIFRVAAAAGVESPTQLQPRHLTFKDVDGDVASMDEYYQIIDDNIAKAIKRHEDMQT
ncbi:FMN-binding glutamate synthase family protein [Barrientosiimonas marina]|uniref:FMN-binding glutamate synthase family protein n=1 Tax=Lentibacillus kimchii TaxID=1542911 RepID=A0ABW2US35_9BACI